MSLALPVAPAPARSMTDAHNTGWSVIDLFSGAGGMSCGFARHRDFEVLGAADAEIGKPSSGAGTLGCNASFRQNIGVDPLNVDLGRIDPGVLREMLGLSGDPVVLSACAPCTGFSRTLARNHLVDDVRNTLTRRIGDFARELRPQVVVLENARELLMGRFSRHFDALRSDLEDQRYRVLASTHYLSEYGLPQRRERALVIAVREDLPLLGLEDLWEGFGVRAEATHVRKAIDWLPTVKAGETHPDDSMHVSPRLASDVNRRRIAAVPHDGGSWFDLVDHPNADELLTPSMKRRAALRNFGSHPDVYGRLAWDRPAATIKRECGHIGNGRYAHPEQDRLCTVRELGLLQGFPCDYQFVSSSLANLYRHLGDAVPPLIAYQLAAVVSWILTDERPEPPDFILPGSSLAVEDLVEA
jgi:DNA (cytosine-5)-methyltransferase 1